MIQILTEEYELLEIIATQRQKKNQLSSTKLMNVQNTHLIGLMGELIYAKTAELKLNLNNYSIFDGDKGSDFLDLDIKTTTYLGVNPLLKLTRADLLKGTIHFGLVRVNLKEKSGEYLGYQSRSFALENRAKYLTNLGYGNILAIPEKDLIKEVISYVGV